MFTYGPRSDLEHNLRCDPAAVGADLVGIRRGGDITYHGPGQLVGYPIVQLGNRLGAAEHVRNVEQLVIDALATFGVSAGRLAEYPGVWVDADGPEPRKICAIGVRLKRGRTMHGFALNVATDMTYLREHIVACGIGDRPVTSLAEEGVARPDARRRRRRRPPGRASAGATASVRAPGRRVAAPRRRPLAVLPGRRARRAGATGVAAGRGRRRRRGWRSRPASRTWLRPKVHHGPEVLELKRTIRDLGLVTVCEDAGCPNLSECWADGTATFMVLGERCTRACGFCLVDTSKPEAPAADEPERVAEAIERMGLDHAVLTMVARDDLADGGMAHVAACVEAIRRRRPGTRVETLVSDARGSAAALDAAVRGPPGRVQPQHRDGGPAAAGGAPVGRLRPQPVRARPGQGGRADDEVRADRGDGRDRRRGRRLPRRPRRHRRRHRHHRPVPAPDVAPPARRALGRAGDVRRRGPASARRSASATSRPAR